MAQERKLRRYVFRSHVRVNVQGNRIIFDRGMDDLINVVGNVVELISIRENPDVESLQKLELIRSAPEMLALLERITASLDTVPLAMALADARALLAKVKG